MAVNSKTITVGALSFIIAGCLGYALGSSMNKKSGLPIDVEKEHQNGVALQDQQQHPPTQQLPPSNLDQKSVDELTASLSEVMLPEEEFNKLGDAIYQTGMGLLMAQAQGSGIQVNEAVEQELKSSIQKKYNRQFFAGMNANAMKELSKEELVAILSFYNTPAGTKFLKLSPKIIEGTMASTQSDLQQWLPATIDALVAKLKSGKSGSNPAQNQPNKQMPPQGGGNPFNDPADKNN